MKLVFIHQPERRGLFSDSGRVHGLPSLALVTFHHTNYHCSTNACKTQILDGADHFSTYRSTFKLLQ